MERNEDRVADGAAGADAEDPPGTATVEATVDEAVVIAIQFLKDRLVDDAERVLRLVLESEPDHPVALHFAGVAAHHQKHYADAVALIERSLQADSSQADWHSNLGIALKAAGRLDDAMAAYGRALALDPSHAKAHNNLGVLQKRRGQLAEAEASFREAIRLNPDYAEAFYNLGNLLLSHRRMPEGIQALNKSLVLSPRSPETKRHLAYAYCMLGEPEKAVEVYDEWLRKEPANAVALHMRAACSGEAVPDRAADEYIEKAFDNFAESFDAKLAALMYRAPQIVAAALADTGVGANGELDVLDAGCGTGLCGPLLRPYARRLVGVDLSGQMIARAQERNVYDDLCRAELTAYLAAHPASFDVVVSADTLVYFGSLDGVAKAAASALRPGGRLVFTVEAAHGDNAPHGYRLHFHGRYLHARGYLEDVLRREGFRTKIVQAELRMESGLPVEGFVVGATAPGPGQGPRNGADDA